MTSEGSESGSWARRLWARRRRIAPVVLLAGALVVAGQVCEAVPRETSVQYRLGPEHEEVSEVSITYELGGESVGGVRFQWPDGAPLSVSHTVDLAPGRYRVRAEIESLGGHRTVTRALRVPAEGTVRIDLFDEAYAHLRRRA